MGKFSIAADDALKKNRKMYGAERRTKLVSEANEAWLFF